jgi:hypothetical protein
MTLLCLQILMPKEYKHEMVDLLGVVIVGRKLSLLTWATGDFCYRA